MLAWLRNRTSQRGRLLGGAVFETTELQLGGETVRVRAVSAAEHLAYNQALRSASPDGKEIGDEDAMRLTADVVARVVVDERGQRVFRDSDAPELAQSFSFEALRAVLMAAIQQSGATQEQIERAASRVKKAQKSASPTD